MNHLLRFLPIRRHVALFCALTLSASAQLIWEGSDNFNDNSLDTTFVSTNRWIGQSAAQGTHSYTETNGRLEVTGDNGSASPTLFRALFWNGGTSGADGLSTYQNSWVMQSDLSLTHAASSNLVQMGIVASARNVSTNGSGFYGLYLSRDTNGTFLRATYGVTGSVDFVNAGEVDLTSNGNINNLQVQVLWDASTHIFTSAYRFDTGSSFTSFGSFNSTTFWTTTPTGFFTNLTSRAFAGANIQAATMSFDNFSVSAVPEPSAFAALAGLATLGLAATRRRRRAA